MGFALTCLWLTRGGVNVLEGRFRARDVTCYRQLPPGIVDMSESSCPVTRTIFILVSAMLKSGCAQMRPREVYRVKGQQHVESLCKNGALQVSFPLTPRPVL